MTITAKNYPYNTNAVSQAQFDEHIKLYHGYVDKINEVTNRLGAEKAPIAANAVYSEYRGLKKGETFALDGVILHEAYFQNMTAETTAPNPKTLEIMNRHFGGTDGWAEDFTNCGKAARGWCVFIYDQRGKSFRNILLDAHDDGMVALAFPLLILDMYEHAYFMDYGKNKDEYIKQFMKSICWKTVGRRIDKLGKTE